MSRKRGKLNSMRVLERAKAAYEVLTFPDSIHSADGVAEALGIPPAEVFKTLVLERVGGGRPLLVMVAADKELDLRCLAAFLGEKKLRMARQADAERLTGLQVGGISALALLNRGFQICLDRAATGHEWIVISAGQRGINLRLRVKDLMAVAGCQLVDAGRD